MAERMFPVLMDYTELRRFPGCPREVPWSLLAPHEKRAKRNHDQSLEKLASRGGLGVTEMLAVLEDRGLSTVGPETQAAVDQLNALVATNQAPRIERISRDVGTGDAGKDVARYLIMIADKFFAEHPDANPWDAADLAGRIFAAVASEVAIQQGKACTAEKP